MMRRPRRCSTLEVPPVKIRDPAAAAAVQPAPRQYPAGGRRVGAIRWLEGPDGSRREGLLTNMPPRWTNPSLDLNSSANRVQSFDETRREWSMKREDARLSAQAVIPEHFTGGCECGA